MNKSRLLYVPVFLALLLSAIFVFSRPYWALGQMTIPTRTPVPDDPDPPAEPTDDNGGGGGDNGDDQPSPTDTPQPTDTPVPPTISIPPTITASPVVLESPTPIETVTTVAPSATVDTLATATTDFSNQFNQIAPGSTPVEFPIVATGFPTAEPCGEPPTFTTLATANVDGGPGSDYPVRETLSADEVRPIVGRAAYATWWLIQLDGKYQQGWISDKAGTVQGFTGNVPIVDAPLINGALPTPGKKWEPTPDPICTPTPTPTSDGSVITGSILDYEGDGSSSEKVNTTSDVEVTDVETAEEQRSQMAEAAAPLELDVPAATPTPNLLPIAGLVLVIAAIFVALFLRRNPGGGDTG